MRALVLVGACVLLAGCPLDPYKCDGDSNCVRGGVPGSCVGASEGSYCAFADVSCPSRMRWDESAHEALANRCVPMSSDGGVDIMPTGDLAPPLIWTRQINSASGARFTAVWGSAPNDVYVVANANGIILHTIDHGTTWVSQSSGVTDSLLKIWGLGRTAVFACGSNKILQSSGNGAWSSQALGLVQSSLYSGIWGTAPSNLYVVGVGGKVTHTTNGGWALETTNTTATLRGVWGSGPNDIYAVGGQGEILHSDGKGVWTAQVSGVTDALSAVWGTSATDVYVTGQNGLLLHSTGNGVWLPQQSGTTATLTAVAAVAPGDLYAVGDLGTVLHSTGANDWRIVDVGATEALAGVWGSGSRDIYVVGENGTILWGH